MRLVLDTNVVASGLLWEGGPPAQLIEAAQAGAVELVTSKTLLAELTTIVTPADIASTSHDPDDDHVLACALAAQADLIVSGDPDLLNLKQFLGMPVVSPREAMGRVAT